MKPFKEFLKESKEQFSANPPRGVPRIKQRKSVAWGDNTSHTFKYGLVDVDGAKHAVAIETKPGKEYAHLYILADDKWNEWSHTGDVPTAKDIDDAIRQFNASSKKLGVKPAKTF